MNISNLSEGGNGALEGIHLASNVVDRVVRLAPVERRERGIDVIARRDDVVRAIANGRKLSHV